MEEESIMARKLALRGGRTDEREGGDGDRKGDDGWARSRPMQTASVRRRRTKTGIVTLQPSILLLVGVVDFRE